MMEERYSRMRYLVGSMVQASPQPLPAQCTGKRQLLEELSLDAPSGAGRLMCSMRHERRAERHFFPSPFLRRTTDRDSGGECDNLPTSGDRWARSRSNLALLAFLAIGAFFLLTEHAAHVFGVLPYLLVLLCPLLHLLHNGHGGHGSPDTQAHQTEGGQR